MKQYTRDQIMSLITVQIAEIRGVNLTKDILDRKLYTETLGNCIPDLFLQDLQQTAIYKEIIKSPNCLSCTHATDNDGYFTYLPDVNGHRGIATLKSWLYEKLGSLISLVMSDFMDMHERHQIELVKKHARDTGLMIRGNHDFWTPAISFIADTLDPKYKDKFKEYCGRQHFNPNEIMFFREMVQNAFSFRMSTVVIGLNAKEQEK